MRASLTILKLTADIHNKIANMILVISTTKMYNKIIKIPFSSSNRIYKFLQTITNKIKHASVLINLQYRLAQIIINNSLEIILSFKITLLCRILTQINNYKEFLSSLLGIFNQQFISRMHRILNSISNNNKMHKIICEIQWSCLIMTKALFLLVQIVMTTTIQN
jgi:hypothetical protein